MKIILRSSDHFPKSILNIGKFFIAEIVEEKILKSFSNPTYILKISRF